jgi:hypothetical protein
VADDANSPSDKAGRGFSHYFGLNDLVASNRPAFSDSGLTAASPHGFSAGETMTFRFTGENGARLRDLQVSIPPGGTVGDLVAQLNDATNGIGRFGAFALAADGSLSFTGYGNPSPKLSVLEDRTTQVPSGVSVTELFGIGGARAVAAVGWNPGVHHLNEGHAGFLTFELIDRALAGGAPDVRPAVARITPSVLFTTHTPVPAGIDRFDRSLIERHLAPFADRWSTSTDDIMALGADPDAGTAVFNMAVLCLTSASRANGVS